MDSNGIKWGPLYRLWMPMVPISGLPNKCGNTPRCREDATPKPILVNAVSVGRKTVSA